MIFFSLKYPLSGFTGLYHLSGFIVVTLPIRKGTFMSKQAFILLMAILSGLYQNRHKIDLWLNPPPPKVAGQTDVVLYSTTWCGYCAKTREYFAENNINYIDLDVEKSTEGRTQYQQMGGTGVPIVVVNGETVIHGYAADEINAALNEDNP
jgi:glutaredoxin